MFVKDNFYTQRVFVNNSREEVTEFSSTRHEHFYIDSWVNDL